MCYVLTDNNFFLGKDFRERPIAVTSKEKAYIFKTGVAADNFLRNIPNAVKGFNWIKCDLDERDDEYMMPEVKKFGNPTKATSLEDENFDIFEFFTQAVQVMSQIDRFIANMVSNEQIVDMKILDVRHYIRDNNHRLSAIQMQRLGYYLQDLEKERYEYKSKRLIASMFASNIEALKDKNNINKMNDVVTSKYRPKVLDDTDIEYIINKKKDVAFIA